MKYLIIVLLAAFVLSCQPTPTNTATNEEVETTIDPYAHIEDEKAREIIKASIEFSGGLDKWQAMQKLKYTKDFALLLESGEVEKSYEQIHDYQMNPLIIDIQSKENGAMIHTRLENGQYSRTKDGEAIETSDAALAKAINTSTYVIGIPFKLLDPGPQITYEGEFTTEDGRVLDVLRVAYDAAQHANHSTSDVWKYYFDKEDRKVVANWVDAGDHYAFIENLTYARAGGILFNKDRKSYRVDSLGNKLYLRAEYTYDNYELQ